LDFLDLDKGGELMEAWKCNKCGYIYKPRPNPSESLKDRVPSQELPAGYCCPVCSADQGEFCKIYDAEKIDRYD
jgi:rubredoxin